MKKREMLFKVKQDIEKIYNLHYEIGNWRYKNKSRMSNSKKRELMQAFPSCCVYTFKYRGKLIELKINDDFTKVEVYVESKKKTILMLKKIVEEVNLLEDPPIEYLEDLYTI